VLRSNGIRSRHYAIDPDSGVQTMSNAQLASAAIRALGDVGPVDVLAVATTIPDQIAPGHAVMVHGELGWPWLEVASLAGICLAGAAALKYAWMSVRSGQAQRAVACASELSSPHLRGRNFAAELQARVDALEAHPELAFEKDFLRWMLSDGAGALLLEPAPRGPLALRLDWIELSSAAQELPVCMHAGARRDASGQLTPWSALAQRDWLAESTFAIQQDVRLLNAHIVRASLIEPLQRLRARRALHAADVDWFLPHLSSAYFTEQVAQGLEQAGLPLPRERWFTNLAARGNTGSASPFIMLDELRRSGRLQAGQRLLMFVPESGRFSSGFIHLTAVAGDAD
jgi:3-oxoacyl-[acyl-carrier-protein] synthase-3